MTLQRAVAVWRRVRDKLGLQRTTPRLSSRAGYQLWSESYDLEPDNMVTALEENLFKGLVSGADLTDRVLVDIGCGTGRHWDYLLSRRPRALYGVDSSPEMMERLRARYPDAMLQLRTGHRLAEFGDESVDLVLSSLMLGYVSNAEEELREWTRILRIGGEILFTDLHPDAIDAGAKRTFSHRGARFEIESYLHPIPKLHLAFKSLHLDVLRQTEHAFNEAARAVYEHRNAMAVYSKRLRAPLVVGFWLQRKASTRDV